jgi:23S rRNA (uracil1939-C5)-methyltransferase
LACIGLAVAEVTVDVTVRAIAAGGSGVADLPDGRVVFVPRTAPGDRARVHIQRSKPRWATGALRALIEPSPSRREAPCVLYDVCGGCQLQHLPYELQLEWKARFVKDALERIGGVALADRPPITGSPNETRYRSRIAFSLRRLGKGRVIAGFHALDRPGRIVDVHDECLLPRVPLLEAWVALRAAWGEGARLLPRGESLRLTLRQDPGGIVLVIDGGEARWSAAPLLEASKLAAIWHRPDGDRRAARLEAGSAEAGSPAFSQVNPEVAESMVDHVLGLVASTGGTGRRRAADAYSGMGEYARRLAAEGWTVTAIELDPVACEAARSAARDGYVVLEGRVEDRLAGVLPADLLIVNPPRAGLGPEVVGVITAAPPERMVYVSCDPATLARDVAGLSDQYQVQSIACFDLFPQTAHVETVVELHRREGALG